MSKFFVAGRFAKNDIVEIGGADGHHIRKVLRMRPDDRITLCDGEGMEYLCSVLRFSDDSVYAVVLDQYPTPSEPSVSVSLFVAVPKADKLEMMVQKAVELGVYEITPFFSERCVSRPDERAMGKKIERLRKISEEAAKQCGRGIIPRVGETIGFSEMLSTASSFELPVMAYEEERSASLKEVLLQKGNFSKVSAVIGSEGGFTPEEADAARASGIKTASLGPRILRCETAPIAILSAIMFHTGNL